MTIQALGSPIERQSTRVEQQNIGRNVDSENQNPKQSKSKAKASLAPEQVFKNSQKKFGVISASIYGGLITSSLVGAAAYGKTFPSKFLQFVGDLVGSGAAVAMPFMQTKNEVNNWKAGKENKSVEFDLPLKFFYRACSHGLVPFIFERYLNPENWRSGFHVLANVINAPFTLFSGYSWAFGNTQAAVALDLYRRAKNEEANATTETEKEEKSLNVQSYKKIYDSSERLLTLGSIANPVMPSMIYAADTAEALWKGIKGEGSISEFFQRPFLGLSKLLSFGIALPEAFAKGVDAFMRVCVNEREHLKPVLWDGANRKLEKWGSAIDKKISTEKAEDDNWVKKLKNNAEMFFHTLSPFAMISLFVPMLDRKYTDDDIQNKGGLPAVLDKWLGRYAQTLSGVFTGFYVAFGRLPQGILQSVYFGRKLYGQYVLKETESVTQGKLLEIRDKIHNNVIVDKVSKFARNSIEKLVPNFNHEDVDNAYGTPNYKTVLANYGFAESEEHNKLLVDILKLTALQSPISRENAKNEILTNPNYRSNDIDVSGVIEKVLASDNLTIENLKNTIVSYAIEHADKECKQGYYQLKNNEFSEIRKIVERKLNETINPATKKVLKPSPPFALFLSRVFLSSLDIQSRLVNWGHDKLLKLEVYEGDEKNKAFNNELEVVCAENADGLRRTINSISKALGLAA